MTSHSPSTLNDILEQLRETAARPMDRATGLPPALYRRDDVAALEKERLFRQDWICVGLAAELAETGDYLTFSIADEPVFCLRDNTGEIKTYANVCRHRMMRLLTGSGRTKQIICPYHAWTYSLNGKLIAAPHMGRSSDFDRDKICLPEIRTEIWQGWIYVTLNADAVPLRDSLAPLAEVVGRYRIADYVPVMGEDLVWRTNWKILTENFMESYHLPIAHRKTVGARFPIEETRFPQEIFKAFTYETFAKEADARFGVAHQDNRHLEGAWRHRSVMPTIFPSHMYVLAPDHLWYLSLRPRDVSEVEVRFGAAIAPEVHAGLDDPKRWLAETQQFFDMVNDEDRMLVEGIYRNTASRLAVPGPLSWLERELHDFQQYLARRLTG